jgi:predicted phage tail component-like protein
MYIETQFQFDDINGDDMGVMLVDINGGMKEFIFGVNQTIIEEKISSKRYLNRVEREPITIPLTITFKNQEDKWDYNKRTQLVQWLFQDNYKPLIFADNPTIVYYVIATGDATRFDNYLQQGYATIQMRTDSPYAYSFPISYEDHDFSNNAGTTRITLINRSNIEKYYYPEMEVTLVNGATGFSVRNVSDGGNILTFSGLEPTETVYIDNSLGRIISSLGKNVYRLSKCNRKFIRLLQGENVIEITGKCKITFKMQFPMAL